MKRKMLSLLLAFALCLSLAPTMAFAATGYNVWVNGEEFTDEKLEIACGSGTAAYDPAKNQITLNNATITNANLWDGAISFRDHAELTVVVVGSNTIELAADAYGIYAEADTLTLTGSGSLEITAPNDYDCIQSYGDLIVDMDGELILTSGAIGLYANNDITVSGSGDITAACGCQGLYSNSGDVDISGSGAISIQSGWAGIEAYYGNIAVSGESDITIDSGDYGFYAGNTLSISGSGNVKVEAAGESGMSACTVAISGSGNIDIIATKWGGSGIYAWTEDSNTISGSGNVTIESDGFAFCDYSGSLTISGSGDVSLKSTGGDAVHTGKGFTISGSGDVTIESPDNACDISDGSFTISGSGDVTISSEAIGIYMGNGSLILSGSGNEVNVTGSEHAVKLWGNDSSVLLNGSAVQISFTANDGVLAILNGSTYESPVAGDNFSDYLVTGAPDTNSVVYKIGKLTVKFDMGGHGTAVADQKVSSGSAAEQPEDPTATGFIFDDWYTDAAFTSAYDFSAAVTKHTTVYAKWLTARTVSFDMGGQGTAPADQTVADGAKAEKPSDPTASGYTFKGWFADPDCKTAFDFTSAITADTTVYAKWTLVPVEYRIIEGADSEWTQGSTDGLLITSDAPFAKFDSVEVDGSTIPAADYTAKEGSTKITLLPAYLETLSVGSHTIEIISNDGSAFTHFTVKEAKQPDPSNYTVSFNMGGHGSQVAAQTVKEGQKATKPADPSASGYSFGGWYANASCTDKFDFNSAIAADVTIYAKWTKNSASPTDPISPETGDSVPMLLCFAFLFVACGTLTGTVIRGTKKKRGNR